MTTNKKRKKRIRIRWEVYCPVNFVIKSNNNNILITFVLRSNKVIFVKNIPLKEDSVIVLEYVVIAYCGDECAYDSVTWPKTELNNNRQPW